MNKSQQLRIATALQGMTPPPKGAAMVKQSDRSERVDRGSPQLSERAIKRAATARRASCSVHTTSGGFGSAPAPEGRGSLRAEIRSVMEQ